MNLSRYQSQCHSAQAHPQIKRLKKTAVIIHTETLNKNANYCCAVDFGNKSFIHC